jgi:hypothetical protein
MTIFVILHRAGIIKNGRNIFLYPGIGIFWVCCRGIFWSLGFLPKDFAEDSLTSGNHECQGRYQHPMLSD